MMAPEKLKPEDIDSAMAVSAQHVRPTRHRDEDAAAGAEGRDSERPPQQTDWIEDRNYEAEIPPYPEEDELRADDDRIGVYGERAAPRRALPVIAGGVALLIVAGLVWWMFRPEPATVDEIPVVTADPGDVKTRPEDEGGMEVPNQEITVYDQISGQPEAPEAEVVMPAPETPISPAIAPEAPLDTAVEAPAAGPDDPAQSEIDAVLAQLQAASAAREAVPQPVGTTEAPAAADATAGAAPAEEPTQVATAPAEAVAQPTASATGVRIQLAAFKSEDQARGAWSNFQQRFPGELSGLSLIIEQADLGTKGIFYRVQTGPLASREAAAAMCDRLKVQGQTCIVAQ